MKTKQLPKGWREVELGDICEVLTGFAFKSNLFNEEEKGKPIIRIRDLAKGKSKTYYSGKFEEKYLVKRGDFLIGMDGEFKVFEWKSENALLNQRVCKLILNKDLVIPKYIYYMISKKLKEIEDKTPFVTVKHISNKQILSIKFILPPTSIQNSIVSILEKAESLKKKRKDADKLTKDYLQSVFCEMFLKENKFEMKQLEEICVKITDGSHRTPQLLNEGYPFLTVANMGDKDFDYSFTKNISREEYLDLVKNGCRPEKGDVLFSKDGTVGKVMRINETKEQVVLSSIAILKPNFNLIKSIYLESVLKTDFVLNQAVDKKSGSAIRRIILRHLKEVEIPLPPIELQQKFASIVEGVEKLKEKQKQSKKEINIMFDSLMKQAFNGELVK